MRSVRVSMGCAATRGPSTPTSQSFDDEESMRAMTKMVMATTVVSLLSSLGACMGDAPKQKDQGGGSSLDPWAGSSSEGSAGAVQAEAEPAAAKKSKKAARAPVANPFSGGMLGGLAMLSKIGDALRQPGPYEAPARSADYDEDAPHWVVLHLGGRIVEQSAFSFSLSGDGGGAELAEVKRRLDELGEAAEVRGVVLRFADLDVSYPDAGELADSISRMRTRGKRVICHSQGTGNVEYLVMTACERVVLAPLGQIAITGPAALPVYLHPLLARFGIVADFLHVGAYKGAAEPYTHDAPSAQSTEVLGAILDRHYATMVETIAARRHLSEAEVKARIDQGLHTPVQAVAAKLADAVASFDDVLASELKGPWVMEKLDGDAQLSATDTDAATQKLLQFLGVDPAARPSEPHVAIVYAVGDIVDGGGDGLLGARQEIAADTLVAALRVLTRDPSVKAVVLRVDSGGGSAQASELIWQAMRELRMAKPLVVSMSDAAASGGYYIASIANKIYAQPDTLTGSIGVIGGKFALGPALAAQGVRSYPVGRGKRATMMNSLGAWSADERQVLQAMMEDVYQTFVQRVAEGRKKTAEEVKAIAAGRIWTGARAKELGLVDELGGLDAAYAEAAKLGGVPADREPEVYPPAPTLRDFAVSYGGEGVQAKAAGLSALRQELVALRLVEPRVAGAAERLLAQLLRFQQSSVQAMAWVPDVR